MKSKRANDYIVEYQRYENGRFVLDIGDVNVVGLIAEEDMAEKAAKAFCALHCPQDARSTTERSATRSESSNEK